jgi:large subunit ribosomal protein L41
MRPTPSLAARSRRLRLTTKMVNGGYYKGTGSGSMGWHTKHGGYVIDANKVRTYKVPENLKDFKVGARIRGDAG